MNILSLSGAWKMRQAGTDAWHDAVVPGSVYADLMRDGTLPDPFWRENEHLFFELLRNDFEYTRTFDVSPDLLAMNRVVLRCFGLDTLCHVFINGQKVADTDNMHITWGFEVKELLKAGENTITVAFDSPIEYCLEQVKAHGPMWGSTDAIPGFGYLRKAHMMFGWDWGPRLPDAGIWREIRLEGIDLARIDGIRVEQIHEGGKVTLRLHPDIDGDAAACALEAALTCPDGTVLPFEDGACVVNDPQLWWPNGIGAHPLYTVKATLKSADGRVQDAWCERVGLRTLTVSREKDEAGETFCHVVNGVKVFAMGGDYIPEDNIYQRINPDRTRRLLEDAALANFNTIRVWGGGYYPDDYFFDICDELGLMVWQDLMFACSFYVLTPEFDASIRTEARQNIRRMRNHASLALICGNNEMEQFMGLANHLLETDFQNVPHARYVRENTTHRHVSDYTKMFEYIFPAISKEEAPQTFWWPSSPSSGGDFDKPQDPTRGDVHYWDVWHGEKPFTDYRNYEFSYVSEFGFQSFPMLPTVETFTEPGDRNIFSRIMERHQRNKSANGKILNYLSQTFRYPGSFDDLLYASQLLQAEAIRYGVEHWRRNRGRCMGAIIWQLNDCWPVASWASIDSLGRWKALHYAAKRFFAPVMISVEEHGELDQNPHINEFRTEPLERSARVSVANETPNAVSGKAVWQLRTADGAVVEQGEADVTVPAFTSVWLDKLVFDEASVTGHYFTCAFLCDGREVSRSSALFCAPKHFDFVDPALSVKTEGDAVTVTAKGYGRQVYIESDDPDLLLSDNFFDLSQESVTVKVLRGSAKGVRVRSVYDLGK